MKTAKQAHEKVKKSAPVNPEIRFAKEVRVGQWGHQGDIAVQMVDRIRGGKETKDLQLAPGTTKGSRHILSDFVGRIIIPNRKGELEGPEFEADERFNVTHPEHAHYSLPAGKYRVIYQRNLELEEIRRVQD